MTAPTALRIAVAAAWAGVAALIAGRFLLAGSQQLTPSSALPALIALAACCLASLTVSRRPTAAWLGAALALVVATLDLASAARVARPALGTEGWRWLSILLCTEAIAASAVAVAFATDRSRRVDRAVLPLGIVGLALVAGASIWALASPDAFPAWLGDPSPLGALGLVTRSMLLVAVVFVALGCAGEIRPAVERARRRLEIDGPTPRSAADRWRRLGSVARLTAEDLAPGRDRAIAAARSERSRIASELHAEVVPAVRRALRDVERGGSPERLAASLHDVLDDVDRLIASRHQIVLDSEGLVPAIEWLAERVEDRSDVRVEIEVEAPGDDRDGVGTPPRPVAEAAYRVVDLALDNVARHAPGAAVRLAVSADDRCVDIAVSDDGPGLPFDAAGRAPGGRGLLDMRAAASAVGAELTVAAGAGRRGTVIRFEWGRR